MLARRDQKVLNGNIGKKVASKRIIWIDVIKTIAIFFVIMYHSEIYSYNVYAKNTNLIIYFRYCFRTLYSTCVPLFFFVNGYLLFNKELKLQPHIFKIIKFIFQTGVWSIITMFVIAFIKGEVLGFKEILEGVWSFKQGWTNHLWYLGTLVCIYIFFPLLKNVYDNNKKYFLYFVVVCSLFTFGNVLLNEALTFLLKVIFNVNMNIEGRNFFNIFNPFRGLYSYAFVYFCLGGLVNDFMDKIRAIPFKKRNICAVIGIMFNCLGLFLVGLLYSYSSNTWDTVWGGYDTIFTLFNVCCIFTLCLNSKKNNVIIETISQNTLGIYLIHMLFIHMTKQRVMEVPELCNLPFNIIYAIGILIISLIISLLLKKIPIINKIIK